MGGPLSILPPVGPYPHCTVITRSSPIHQPGRPPPTNQVVPKKTYQRHVGATLNPVACDGIPGHELTAPAQAVVPAMAVLHRPAGRLVKYQDTWFRGGGRDEVRR